MCFSATASFIAAGVLTSIGAAGLYLNKKPSYTMLALIPVLFAVQQAAEGIVWLTINSATHTTLHVTAAYIFLFFAGVVWPSWSPISLWMIEKDTRRRTILAGLSILGILGSCYSIWQLITESINPSIVSCSIAYNVTGTTAMPYLIALVLYNVAAVLPTFVSSIRYGSFFGSLLLISLVVSHIVKYESFGSVWCFFAAILSILIVVEIVVDQERVK